MDIIGKWVRLDDRLGVEVFLNLCEEYGYEYPYTGELRDKIGIHISNYKKGLKTNSCWFITGYYADPSGFIYRVYNNNGFLRCTPSSFKFDNEFTLVH